MILEITNDGLMDCVYLMAVVAAYFFLSLFNLRS